MASPQKVKTPRSAVLVVSVGGSASLAAAAAISFQGLTGLGMLAAIERPWLLPLAIDIYAAICTLAALLLPADHPARPAAVWNARAGLAMSMAGNAADRAMHLGSFTVADAFLTFVGAWPSLIVERLLHLQGRLATDATATESATVSHATPPRRDTATRPLVAPVPGAPVARPAVTATPASAPVAPAATATVAPRKPASATKTPVAVNDVVLALMAQYGVDGVTGPMVGDALGKHRGTGARHLDRVRKDLKSGKLTLPAAAPATTHALAPVGAR